MTELVARLTFTVDDEILKRARIRALEQGTSVKAVLAERLRAFAGEGEAQLRPTEGPSRLPRTTPGARTRPGRAVGGVVVARGTCFMSGERASP